jgi:HAE1 family hydrophobic/amphiphilic exporter-1
MSTQNLKQKLDGMLISDTSIRQPVLVTMVMLLFVVFGVLAFFTLPVELIPDTASVRITVTVPYPGANPATVAEEVAEPIEDELSTLSGIDHLTTVTRQGQATIIAEFETDVNEDIAYQDVREKVSSVEPTLPDDAEDPIYQRFDITQLPILSVAVAGSGSHSPLELRRVVEDEIVPRIQRVQGVGSVSVNGGRERQVKVLLDLDEMNARTISPVQVINALEAANTNLGMGSVQVDNTEINLHTPPLIDEPQDINIVRITGTPYRIGDIAQVKDGVDEVDQYTRLNGDETITIDVRKQSGTNTVEVVSRVRAEMQTLFERQPELSYSVIRDDSTFVEESTRSSLFELVTACLAALVVVFLFFRDVRGTFITIAGLPIILIGTFAAFALFGMSINLITLVAMAVSVGLVIDDAIVVRENIFSHMEQGELPIIASSRGTAEVSVPVLAMTLTVIAVFVPITFTTGATGIIFRSFGLAIASAVVISLIEAFTLAPMMSAYVFKNSRGKKSDETQPSSESEAGSGSGSGSEHESQSHASDGSGEKQRTESEKRSGMARGYAGLLRWSLRHRLLVVVLAVGFIVGSVYTAQTLRFAFMPEQESGEFYVGFEMPPGTPLEVTNEQAKRAEEILMNDPGVQEILADIGGEGTPDQAEFFVKLTDEASTPTVRERLREKMDFLPRLAFSVPGFGGGQSTRVSGRQVQLSLETSQSIESIAPLVNQIEQAVEAMSGVVDVGSSYQPGQPRLEFSVQPVKAGDAGVTSQDIAATIRTMFDGTVATALRQSGDDTDILVRLREEDRANIRDLEDVSVPTAQGMMPLGSLVELETDTSPSTLRRYDRANQVLIGTNTEGRTANQIKNNITSHLEQMELPPHLSYRFVGESEQMSEGFSSLLIAMGLSVIFVYMVLASQFGSYTQPLVIMLAMPFSFMGSFLALKLLGLKLTITSMMALVLLLGLVVKNSILLVEVANRYRSEGQSANEAMVNAGAVRLRPILMTSISLIAGVLPVVIGIGEGTEVRRGLSTSIMGGMISSTLLTLLVVPTAYSLLASAGNLVRRNKGDREPATSPSDAAGQQARQSDAA